MRITCVGGGPSGLYFSILMKLREPAHDVVVFERDPEGSTYGWGVVYWDDLLEQLRANDPATAAAIREASMVWHGQVLDVDGSLTARPDGGMGYAIGRERLLDILGKRAADLGVQIRFEHAVDSPLEVHDADLIVACDGVGSRLRQFHADHFEPKIAVGRNKYIWLGTNKIFDSFVFAMAETEAGWIWFHGYRFDDDTSTCVVECPPETWTGLHLDTLDPDAAVELLSEVFARALDQHPLLNQGSRWLNFRTVTNEKWHHDNVVLMGDAAHTAHFTIGAGTKLALEDAIVLAAELDGGAPLEASLDAYERERRASLRQIQSEARFSALWFENISRYASLNNEEFFDLLLERRSPLLSRLPPRVYHRMRMVTRSLPALGRFRRWVEPRVIAAYYRLRR